MNSATAARLLGVGENASVDEIKAAYRSLSKSAHPDGGGSGEEFTRLGEARDLLTARAMRRAPGGGFGSGPGTVFETTVSASATFSDMPPVDPEMDSFVREHNQRVADRRRSATAAEAKRHRRNAARLVLIDGGVMVNYRSQSTFVEMPPEVFEAVDVWLAEVDAAPVPENCGTCARSADDFFRSSVCPECGRVG